MSLTFYFNDKNLQLRELPQSMWEDLRDLYLADWPANSVGYYTLDNYIRWLRIEPNIQNINIYTLEPFYFQKILFNGTFLIVDHDQLFLNTLNGPQMKSLHHALNLLDWSSGYEVNAVLDRHKQMVMDVIESEGLALEWDNIATKITYFKKEKTADLELNCPDDIDLRPLSKEDVMIANSESANRNFDSILLLKRLVKLNPSIAAFKKDTGEIVAWCLLLQTGSLKVWQLKNKNMEKDYGSLVVRAMTKMLAENSCDSFACVKEDNEIISNIFTKCGFEFMDVCNYLCTKPTEPVEKKLYFTKGLFDN